VQKQKASIDMAHLDNTKATTLTKQTQQNKGKKQGLKPYC
jgi:hypothetical protein